MLIVFIVHSISNTASPNHPQEHPLNEHFQQEKKINSNTPTERVVPHPLATSNRSSLSQKTSNGVLCCAPSFIPPFSSASLRTSPGHHRGVPPRGRTHETAEKIWPTFPGQRYYHDIPATLGPTWNTTGSIRHNRQAVEVYDREAHVLFALA